MKVSFCRSQPQNHDASLSPRETRRFVISAMIIATLSPTSLSLSVAEWSCLSLLAESIRAPFG